MTDTPNSVTTAISHDIQWLRTHLVLLALVVILAGGSLYGIDSIIARHDEQQSNRDQQLLTLVTQQTTDLKTRMAQDEQTIAQRDAQYQLTIQQLSQLLTRQTVQLQQQVKQNSTLNAQQTAEAIQSKLKAQLGEVTAVGDNVQLDLPIARTVNSTIDTLTTTQLQLTETEKQLQAQTGLTTDANLDAANAKQVINSQDTQIKTANKACQDQIKTVKAQSRKGKLKWFSIGYLLGLASAHFIGIQETMEKSRIVFLDVENSPSVGYVWGKYDQTVVDFKADWFMLSFAYKIFGEKKTHVHGLIDYPGYMKNKDSDNKLMQDLWKVLDEADIVIGHNLDKFDVRKANARFLIHGMMPPSPYKTVDTLKIARKAFKFNSNSLDDLGHSLGLGRKLKHIGFALWLQCMSGDSKAWSVMKKYNIKDVVLLEKVYLAMRPWATTHANVNRGEFACPKCGSTKTQKRGFSYTLLMQKQRHQCLSCFGWWEGRARKPE